MRRSLVLAAMLTLAGLLLGLLGPFGSYLNNGLGLRLAYWVGSIWVGALFYGAMFAVAHGIAPPGTRANWPMLIIASGIASIPQSIITRTAAFWVWPALASVGLSWPIWYAQTAMVGLMASTIYGVAMRRAPTMRAGGPMPVNVSSHADQPLPVDVIALQMEDHYVRVHTPHGSTLVLMPLGRAIAATPVEGLRTHRSWWVARHAVSGVNGTPRAMSLHLSNGVTAPVARSAVAHLRAAGWISA